MAVTPAAACLLLYACVSFSSDGPGAAGAEGGVDASSSDVSDALALADAVGPDAGLEDARDAADAAECVYETAASTSGEAGTCSETYRCQGTEATITCSCPAATCVCPNGTHQLFICTGSCQVPPSQRTACGLPAAGGGSSSSSSSSGGP